MASHVTFWAIAGTAAPIIALANVVSISDAQGAIMTLGPHGKATQGTNTARGIELLVRWTRWAFEASLVNFLAQALVLLLSLLSLTSGNDTTPPLVATCLLTAGLVAVGLVTLWVNLIKPLADRANRHPYLFSLRMRARNRPPAK